MNNAFYDSILSQSRKIILWVEFVLIGEKSCQWKSVPRGLLSLHWPTLRRRFVDNGVVFDVFIVSVRLLKCNNRNFSLKAKMQHNFLFGAKLGGNRKKNFFKRVLIKKKSFNKVQFSE